MANNGKCPLSEAIILAGIPVFIKYANGDIESCDTIEEDTRIAKERIYGIIAGHPKVATFCLGLALAGLISTAFGIAEPHHAMATIDTGGGGGGHP